MTATLTPGVEPSQAAASEPISTKPVKKRGVLHYVSTGISFGLLALVVLLAVMVIVLPAVTKSTPYTVLTGSMIPTYPPGTLVIVKPIDPQQIRLGDVVTYQVKSGESAVITHRVIQIVAPTKVGGMESFITKGDANSLADTPVKAVQIRGKVWYAVPYIGWINNVISGGSRAVIIPIVAGLLFLYAAYMAASTVVDRQRKKTLAARAARQASLDQ